MEEQRDDEDRDPESPLAKRGRKGKARMELDAEEAAFASIFSPLRPTAADVDERDENGDVANDFSPSHPTLGDVDEGKGEAQEESDTGEDESEHESEHDAEISGFLDNGVCYSVFSRKYY